MICLKCKKEIPECSYPRCSSDECLIKTVKLTIKSKEGGIYTYILGYKYPYKGSPDPIIVDQVASVKRAFIATIKLFPILFISPTHIHKWISQIYSADLKKKQLPDIEFCESAREFIRVGKKLTKHIDTIYCFAMFYEFDGAYRFRLQDILAELNKDNLKKNPRKEIIRLIEIWKIRELPNEGVRNKFMPLTTALKIALLIPSVKNFVKKFLLELDLDKIKPDKGDLYFMTERFDYNYGGKTYKERQIDRQKEDESWKEEPIDPFILANVSVTPNSWFFKMTNEQVEKTAEEVKNQLIKAFALLKKT